MLKFLTLAVPVALNAQTAGTDMDLNQGRFLVNGRSGYILKPAYMRDRATEFDPITLTRGDWLKHKMLHVMVRISLWQHSKIQIARVHMKVTDCFYVFLQIISAQQLPKVNQKKSSIVDPLVRVEVYGVPGDVAVRETSHVNNNGTVSFFQRRVSKQ